MTHLGTQVIITFVAGFILGMAVFHLLPHALEGIEAEHGFESLALWIMAGVATVIIMLRLLGFHQHEFGSSSKIEAELADRDAHLHSSLPMTFVGVILGLSMHTVIEGVTLGTSIRFAVDGDILLPGLGVALAIFLHKPLDAYSITIIMRDAGISVNVRWLINIGFALICPITAIFSYFVIGTLEEVLHERIISAALAFGTGAFLCIALYDLLPEISFHKHDRFRLLGSLFVGVALAYGLFFLEDVIHQG